MALDIEKTIHLTETRGGGHMVSQTTQECASQPGAVAEGLTMTMSPKAAELALLIVHFFLETQGSPHSPLVSSSDEWTWLSVWYHDSQNWF